MENYRFAMQSPRILRAFVSVQKKIQDEMNEQLERKLPSLEDRLLLTRLEAAIAETQRLRSVVPVGIPHGTIEVILATNRMRKPIGAILLHAVLFHEVERS